MDKLSMAVDKSRYLVALLTPNSINKPWVRFELSQAMDREVRDDQTSVIAMLLHECNIPPFLRNKIYIDLRDWGNFEKEMQRLAVVVKGDIVDLPSSFRFDGLDSDHFTEDQLFSLPLSQAIIERYLRAEGFRSRTVRSLSRYSGLTPKQVISYCERSPHIILSPIVSHQGEIHYGLKTRIMKRYSSIDRYRRDVEQFLRFLQITPSLHYRLDVMRHFTSFYEGHQAKDKA